MANPENRWTGTLMREAMNATSLGWELAFPIFGGVLLGHYLDRTLETGYVFTLGLLFLGVVSGFYNLWRFLQRMQRCQRLIGQQDAVPENGESEEEAA